MEDKKPAKKAVAEKAPVTKKQAKKEAKSDLASMTTVEIVASYGKNETDTGNVSVQIALLTKRINELTEHLRGNKQDKHSHRGLLQMVGQRRGLLSYLEDTNLDEYRSLKERLGIR